MLVAFAAFAPTAGWSIIDDMWQRSANIVMSCTIDAIGVARMEH
jgi:hypothetical protein